MSDFLGDLAAIKADMVKSSAPKDAAKPKINPNKDEIKEHFLNESKEEKFARLQDEFADFIKQVDKSKVVVQKALDEAQLLFDSLMQQYFG